MAAADWKKAVAKPAWPAAVQMNATYPPPAFARLNPAGFFHAVGPDSQGGAEDQVGLHGEEGRVGNLRELDGVGAAQDVLGGGEKDVAGTGEVFGPHGGLLLKGSLMAVISINHGASSSLFSFCVQLCLDVVGFWGVCISVWALVSGGHRLAPVSAAALVGARRSPLGSNTRAGRRDQGVWAEQRREKRRSKNRQALCSVCRFFRAAT